MADDSKKDTSDTSEASLSIKISNGAKVLQKVARPMIAAATTLLPIFITVCSKMYAIYNSLPHNAIQFLIGFVFCFFGGMYPTLFAAIQAAKHGGMTIVTSSLSSLASEAMTIIEASKKDDTVDADNDGVADVNQIDNKTLILRKANLFMTKCDPIKVDNALSALNRVWISVFATLSLQFARTISLALTISDFLKNPLHRFVAPTLSMAVPKDYQRWVPVVLGWMAKSIAMSIAWYIQTIISAFTSALEGGLIMARTILKVCVKKQWTLRGWIPQRHEDTNIDEYLSYIFAALGFYFQFKLGFDMPFPLNFLLFPFELTEYYIRWAITSN